MSPRLVDLAARAAPPTMDAVTVLRWTFLAAVPFAAVLSFVVYLFFAPRNPDKEGGIKLLVNDGEGEGIGRGRNGYARVSGQDEDGEEEKKVDLFDLEDEEVMLDGQPIQEEAFWRKMALRKMLFIASLLPPLVLNLVALGYILASASAADAPTPLPALMRTYAVMSTLLLVPFHLYVLVQAVRLRAFGDVARHWNMVVHLSAVLFVAFFTQLTVALLPADPSLDVVRGGGGDAARTTIEVLRALQPAVLLLAGLVVGTMPRAPPMYFPPDKIYTPKTIVSLREAAESDDPKVHAGPRLALDSTVPNVTGEASGSVIDYLFFNYCSSIIGKAGVLESLDVWDLPVVRANMRALGQYKTMRKAYGATQKQRPSRGGQQRKGLPPGWNLLWKMYRVNWKMFTAQAVLASVTACAYYAPSFFLKKLVEYLEQHPDRSDQRWGWIWCFSLFASNAMLFIAIGLMWQVSSTTLQSRIKLQLNTILFSKTLVKKDLASAAAKNTSLSAGETAAVTADLPAPDVGQATGKKEPVAGGEAVVESEAVGGEKAGKGDGKKEEEDDEDVTSKSQIMTLFTVDVDRVADFVFHTFSLVDAPIEIVFGSFFLYSILGSSALWGLLAAILSIPMNHFASKIVVNAQDNLMKSRDERTALMNEVLGAIRMLKFNAWERKFEKRIHEVRDKELSWIRRNYMIEVFFTFVWSLTPILVTVTAFLHFVLVAKKPLTPSIAFTAVAVFNELRFALNALPETFIQSLQGFVSLRRIEKYMAFAEVSEVIPSESGLIAMNSATITWPRDKAPAADGHVSMGPSAAPTPGGSLGGFTLSDVNVNFPEGKLSLICGKLGSGKTLLLLGLLGEADCLAGQVICPRSPPNALDSFGSYVAADEWVVKGLVAYCPQSAFLQNASIKNNILFGSPFDGARYQRVLDACSLSSDLKIMEDGDETEIGEKGLNLSGGQKARVSLARAVYSRASVLLMDDILSAVDAHTSASIMEKCFQGELLRDRTVILVSHHVQLVSPAAAYIVALDNGDVTYCGDRSGFIAGGFMEDIEQQNKEAQQLETPIAEKSLDDQFKPTNKHLSIPEGTEPSSETSSINESESETLVPSPEPETKKKPARKLIEDEKRATGRIAWPVWKVYLKSQGSLFYWVAFALTAVGAAAVPIFENGWLSKWSDSYSKPQPVHTPTYYVLLYALITIVGSLLVTIRFGVLYIGSIRASRQIHNRMLERILRATVRFHDTAVRGRVLNRFGKDMENMDSSIADSFGRCIYYGLNILVTFSSIIYVGGWRFAVVSACLFVVYYDQGSKYGTSSRDLRRLDSTTKSPLYALYSEVVSGVQVLRAYGGSTQTLRLMLSIADTNTGAFIWFWCLNRWISTRFNVLSSLTIGLTGVAVLIGNVSAAQAGFALAFAASISNDLLFIVRRIVSLEQSMVAMERIKEYSEVPVEGDEFVEPRPAASWPNAGELDVKDLVIRYAPDLPNVLHKISFNVKPSEKVGIVGATGCGKSTLALSLFRFVEPTEGEIKIDGINISHVGLTDLRSRITIIPQDPTILSGTLRSTLDVFDEYDDHEIYEALRRVHLLKADDVTAQIRDVAPVTADDPNERNQNVFKNLDSTVSEGGENFSQGERQLICMARAILKRNKVLVMDEATASIDYETDELISKTIREEFAESTLLTIAHRLATIIDYDKVLVMDKGQIMEYDSPAVLLRNKDSRFYALCKASGPSEFKSLRHMANEAERRRKEGK